MKLPAAPQPCGEGHLNYFMYSHSCFLGRRSGGRAGHGYALISGAEEGNTYREEEEEAAAPSVIEMLGQGSDGERDAECVGDREGASSEDHSYRHPLSG